MPRIEKSDTLKSRVRFAMIGSGLKLLARSLNKSCGKDPWFDRALDQFDGVWRFESGDRKVAWHLVLQNGKFKVARDWPAPANFTFTLFSPSDLSLRVPPEHILEVIIANKIGQSGDLYYLYQFGFIMSLFRRIVTPKFLSKTAPAEGS